MLLLIITLISLVAVSSDASCAVSDYSKVDCGYYGINQATCESKGCCWASSSVGGIPWCFFNSDVTSTSCFGYKDTMTAPFNDTEVSVMRKYFLANINIQSKGGVVAAPDYNTPGGSYYYHWMRDGALTMRCLQETNPDSFSSIEETVKAYVQWVLKVQNEADPNNIDIRTEPKFELPNGEVFTGAWCRPQNDGPGLRATALMLAADSLIAAGEMSYVQQYLWTGDKNKYNGGAIKYDLDYVITNYNTNTCDLWEEIRDSDLFWNRATMKKAMILGASFASKMGDEGSASSYLSAMAKINSTLYSAHYNGAFYQECASRTRDSAVIVGFNDAYDKLDGLLAPTSIEVAKTVSSYNDMFCSQYSINTADTSNGLPGVLYGRYQGDTYAGGNPWVLSTAALGSLLYRAAAHVLSKEEGGLPSEETRAEWKAALNSKDDDLPSDPAALAAIFVANGDGVMLRLRAHVEKDGFHLDEQIDRNTGEQKSAKDLTWSYAEVLNAMYYRGIAIQALKA